MVKIFPSLISSDILNLEQTVRALEPLCAGFHLDIMDFNFVPNLTWGPGFINAIRKVSKKQLWVHLMVDQPEKYLQHLTLHAGDIVSIHYENMSNDRLSRIFRTLQENNLKASLAISPKTPIEVMKHFAHNIDQVLLMSVEPGFSGQVLLPGSYERLQTLYDLREEHNLHFTIGVDGGINGDNFSDLVQKGADDLAIASGIFATQDPVKTLAGLVALL